MKWKLFRRESKPEVSVIASADVLNRVVSASTPTTAMKVAAVYRAVNLISDGIASMTFQYKRFNSVGRYFHLDTDTFVGKRMNYLLSVQPNDRMNAFDFWKTAICQILLTGNAYICPVRDIYGDPEQYILLTAGSCIYDKLTGRYTVSDCYNGIIGSFGPQEIIHLKNYSEDGMLGMSTISYGARILGIAATSDAETENRFASGGRYKAIISNDKTVKGFGEYQDGELSSAARDFEAELRAGHDIISIPGDVKVSTMNMTSADMQFLDSRKFTIREIARLFGVPAAKLMDDTNSVYGSAEAANLAFYSEALQPVTTRIEREFNAKMLGMSGFLQNRFQFDITSLFALDRKSMADWNMNRLQTGQVCVNDLRREDGHAPVEHGDDLYVSVNLAPIGSRKLNGEKPSTDE